MGDDRHERGAKAHDLNIREQRAKAGVTFWLKATGSLLKKDGVTRKTNPYKQGSAAKELGLDIAGERKLF